MKKETLYIIVAIIAALAVVVIIGEYFTYQYYTSLSNQNNNQSSMKETPLPDQPHDKTGSSENKITSFNFQNPLAAGSINQTDHTIVLTVRPYTNVIDLTPTIEISPGAIVSPGSGVSEDFMKPVTYTVTAQNGSVQTYIVTVNVASVLKPMASGKSITSFTLEGVTLSNTATINENTHAIYLIVPDAVNLTALSPLIGISEGASVNPASKSLQDFTNPVIYTVTAQNGASQDYTVSIVNESNSG